MKTYFIAGVLTASLFGNASRASILSYVASTPGGWTTGQSAAGNPQTLQVQGFDSSLGVLTGVTLTVSGKVAQMARGEKLDTGTSPFSYSVFATVSLDKNGGPNLYTSPLISISGSGTLQAFDGSIDFKGPSAFQSYPDENISLTTDTLLSSVYVAPPALFSSFLSSGLLDYTARAVGGGSVTGSGSFVSQTVDLPSLGLLVEYAYTPIPEPSLYATLLGAASLGIVTIRRRRSAVVD